MAAYPRLVNKQFNSPIGLYSEQNIRDVIERDSQILANGAVGINFNNPSVGKPANLQNSAVLRMLEEEEQRQRNGFSASDINDSSPNRNKFNWPPPEHDLATRLRSTFKDVVTSGGKRVTWPPPQDDNEAAVQQIQPQSQGGSRYNVQSPNPQNNIGYQGTTNPSARYPLRPLDISPTSPTYSLGSGQNSASLRPSTPSKQWAPVPSPAAISPMPSQYHPQQYHSPQPHQQSPQCQQPFSPQRYQPPQQPYAVAPQQPYAAAPQQPYAAAPQQPYAAAPQQHQQPPPNYPAQQSLYQPHSVAAPTHQGAPQVYNIPVTRAVEPPPSTITLRQQAPVSQAPPPVVTSQPATATFKGGKHLRGDLKWPPETVKKQFEEENRARVELAKGPACRPLAIRKDYRPFFAQHALNSSYPGYKAPPGTQFYEYKAW